MEKVNGFSGITVLLFGLLFTIPATALSYDNGIGNLTVSPDVSYELSTHTQFANVTMFNDNTACAN